MFVGLNLRISGSGRELQRLSPTAQSPSGGVVEWSGMEWSGMEWNGLGWSGVEWGGPRSSPNYPDHKQGLPAVCTYKEYIFCYQLINFFKSRPDLVMNNDEHVV